MQIRNAASEPLEWERTNACSMLLAASVCTGPCKSDVVRNVQRKGPQRFREEIVVTWRKKFESLPLCFCQRITNSIFSSSVLPLNTRFISSVSAQTKVFQPELAVSK